MKNKIKIIVEKNYYLNKYSRKLYVSLNKLKYNIKYSKNEVDDKIILFESYNARNISCTPKRILEIMSNDEKFNNYKLIVSVRDDEKYKKLYSQKNIHFVKYNSNEYYTCLSKAKYLFVNSRLPKYVTIKKEQVYIQCWHGTPLKRLGADIIDNGRNGIERLEDTIESYINEGKRISYFLSPSKYASDKFCTAFCLDKLNKSDCLLEIGYPRNDFLTNISKIEINALKDKYAIDKSKKTILYAPTWRDNEYSAKDGYTHKLALDIEKLQKQIGNDFQILLRSHYFISSIFDTNKYDDFIIDVSKIDDINELYVISDMLITDYSSVFFDYSILKKPILFYMYDKKIYEDSIRGFYLNLDELPGAIIETEQDLYENIISPKFDIGVHNKFIDKFCYLDDGQAGERLINMVIKNG